MENNDKETEVSNTNDVIVFEPSKMVNVPSSAIHIENNISLIQKKLWFELVYFAFPKMGTQRRYTITLRKLRELLGWSESTSSDDRLKEALHGLNSTAIKWNIFGKDKKRRWQSFPMLGGCDIPDKSGLCIFEFSSFLEERFLTMGEEAYVKIDLIISKKFQSKYALSLYCLALDFLMLEIGYSEKKFSLEELRRYLALKEGEYKLTGDFNKRVIKPAEDEINISSDMNIEIKPFKEGNKIAGYKLCMSLKQGRAKEYLDKKNKLKELTITNKNEGVKKEYIQAPKRQTIQIHNEQLKKFFAKYSIATGTDSFQEKLREAQETFTGDKLEGYLVFLMKYAEGEYSKGSIKNFAGFFVSLFKDDTQIDNYLVHQEEEKLKEAKNSKVLERYIRIELENKYDAFITDDFQEYVFSKIDDLSDKLTQFINETVKKGFVYDHLIMKLMGGIFSIEKYMKLGKSHQLMFFTEFRKNTDLFGYKEPSFTEWKNEYVTQEMIDRLKEELNSNKRF